MEKKKKNLCSTLRVKKEARSKQAGEWSRLRAASCLVNASASTFRFSKENEDARGGERVTAGAGTMHGRDVCGVKDEGLPTCWKEVRLKNMMGRRKKERKQEAKEGSSCT